MTKPKTPAAFPTRDRVVYAAAQLIRTNGVSGTGLREIAATADAPWGSIAHYFPEGKDQFVDEALAWSTEFAVQRGRSYPTSRNPTPSGLFAWIVQQWQDEVTTRGYERGCPLVATTADVVAESARLRESVATGFASWQGAIVDALRQMGVTVARAKALAVVMLSSLEGAIVLARAQQSTAPLKTIVRELKPLLDQTV